ncbi:MAG TPA: SPOR domain-containing protein, partial [Rhizomicrobium sp.]|nr:SPOR domain-containing protein [Rhizomicrobium sp.]
EDEDAAEAVRASDENFSLIHGEGASPAPSKTATSPQAATSQAAVPQPAVPPVPARVAGPVPGVRPTPRPDGLLASAQAQLIKTAVNTQTVNAPKPQMRPSLREDVGEGDMDSLTPSPGHNWTIQIGAYADKALADAQLKSYYGKAQDVLARASKIIAPLQSPTGQIIYRARFGLFAEREAREVCNRLTQRGQTCFAAVQTR